MKKILFCIMLLGLLSIGTYTQASTINIKESPLLTALTPLTTVNITVNFGIANCPAWCYCSWTISIYEYNSISGQRQLLTSTDFVCTKSSYLFSGLVIDTGYDYIYCTVNHNGNCGYQYDDWSGYWMINSGSHIFYPYICG